ncbi:hypothetical protein ACFLX1_00380 [Chloroflexota bacterium]
MPIKAKWIEFKKEIIEYLALKESGVYEIGKAKGDVVLYIGQSDTSIRSRLLIHKGKTDFVACTHFRKRKTSPDDAGKAEDKLITEYEKRNGKRPPLNKNKSPGDPYKNILY